MCLLLVSSIFKKSILKRSDRTVYVCNRRNQIPFKHIHQNSRSKYMQLETLVSMAAFLRRLKPVIRGIN
jgi:hypothetical protein